MKTLRTLLIAALVLTSGAAWAQHDRKGEIKDTVGPMTEPVIRQRLHLLGYDNVKIEHSNTLRYQIRATRRGKPATLQFHPQTGEILDVTRGKKPKKVWTMPVEPKPAEFRPEGPVPEKHPANPH